MHKLETLAHPFFLKQKGEKTEEREREKERGRGERERGEKVEERKGKQLLK